MSYGNRIPIADLTEVREPQRRQQPEFNFVPSIHAFSQGEHEGLMIVFGNHILGMAADSGAELWPLQRVGMKLLTPPLFANVDEDKALEAIFIYDDNQNDARSHIRVFSLENKSFLPQDIAIWSSERTPSAIADDLDGDGRSEVIIAWRHLHIIDWHQGTVRRLGGDGGISAATCASVPRVDDDEIRDLVLLGMRSREEMVVFSVSDKSLLNIDGEQTKPSLALFCRN